MPVTGIIVSVPEWCGIVISVLIITAPVSIVAVVPVINSYIPVYVYGIVVTVIVKTAVVITIPLIRTVECGCRSLYLVGESAVRHLPRRCLLGIAAFRPVINISGSGTSVVDPAGNFYNSLVYTGVSFTSYTIKLVKRAVSISSVQF